MARPSNNSVETVLDRTLQHLQYEEADLAEKLQKDYEKLKDVIRSAAVEYMSLEQAQHIRQNPKELERYLPESGMKMIAEGGLTIPHTYKININRREIGKPTVDFIRDGKTFKPTEELATLKDIENTKVMQYASIIIEAVLLVIEVVGIAVEVSDYVMHKVAQETAKSSSILQQELDNLQKVFEDSSSTVYQKANAIFILIKDSYLASILWTIIKGLCSNTSYWDWMKTAGTVTAMIIAAIDTGGAALIAKIVLALDSAYEFCKKIVNLTELDNIKRNMHYSGEQSLCSVV